MIVDFQSHAASQPKYHVSFQAFQSQEAAVEILGKRILISNLSIDKPAANIKEVASDELVFSKSSIEYFRFLLLSVAERLAREDPAALQAPPSGARSESDFLRPVFNQTLTRGRTMWEAIREYQTSPLPIPEDFLVFLPSANARNPDREDIIRALVPFRFARQEALKAGWEDNTVAIRIQSGAAKPAAFIMQ